MSIIYEKMSKYFSDRKSVICNLRTIENSGAAASKDLNKVPRKLNNFDIHSLFVFPLHKFYPYLLLHHTFLCRLNKAVIHQSNCCHVNMISLPPKELNDFLIFFFDSQYFPAEHNL